VDVENADGEAAGDDSPAGDPGNDVEHRDGNVRARAIWAAASAVKVTPMIAVRMASECCPL
jgi:hypothetical protein